MKRAGLYIICLLILVLSGKAFGESAPAVTVLSVESQNKPQQKSGVTAVYGVTADDYLPATQFSATDYLNPKVRRSRSRPSFDLPDAFYFIGGPIFLMILLRVLVIFINGFEEIRKEEENQVASEHFNPE